jgi:hypothetical protein
MEDGMRRIQVVIQEVDNATTAPPKQLATFDLPEADLASLRPETALDDLEATTHQTGNAILRRTLQAQAEWRVGSVLAASRGPPTARNLTQDLSALTNLLSATL